MAGSGGAGSGSAAPPATFTEVYSMMFPRATNAQCEACHALPAHDVVNGNLETGMTQQSAYDALVGKKSTSSRCMQMTLVAPKDPDHSLFYLKLTATPPCGVRMPNGGKQFTDAQLEMIRSWIDDGAPNN